MISFNYQLTTYTDFLNELALFIHTKVQDNKLIIPPEVGQGYFQLIQLPNGLEALVYDFELKTILQLKRERTSNEYYTLVLDETDRVSGFTVAIGTEKMQSDVERSTAFYLTSFLYDVETILYKDVRAKGVRVLLTVPWMQQYLQLAENETVLEKYINMKTAGIWHKPVGDEVRSILKELVSGQDIPLLFYQNKILRIIERFFAWLYDEMKVLSDRSGINRHDIEMAQKIESILTNDITKLPPTIKEMAKDVAMSESKLKKVFKSVYGLPPYEYYQKQRMQKARLMLMSGRYSIKDIGYTLGYANLSNFTLAFKKVFNRLPSDILRSQN